MCRDRNLKACFIIVTLTLVHDGRAVKNNVVMFTLEIRILLSAEIPPEIYFVPI